MMLDNLHVLWCLVIIFVMFDNLIPINLYNHSITDMCLKKANYVGNYKCHERLMCIKEAN